MSKLPATTGWEWLRQGFGLLRQQPAILMMLFFSNLLIVFLVSSLPFLGAVLAPMLIPSMSMAILEACRMIAAGERVPPNVLFVGFRRDTLRPLLKLGAVYFAVALILLLAVSPWIDFQAVKTAAEKTAAGTPTVDPQSTMAIVTFGMLMGLAMLGMSFAPPLTMWKRMSTFKALFYSIFAVIGSFGSILLMLLSWFSIYLLVFMAVNLILGNNRVTMLVLIWLNLVFTLILQCGIYAAYRQLLPDTKDDSAAPAPVNLDKPAD